MAHKHTRSHHKRTHPAWQPHQRTEGGTLGWELDFKLPSPRVARDCQRIQREVTRRAEVARAAGQEPPLVIFVPGLTWPV